MRVPAPNTQSPGSQGQRASDAASNPGPSTYRHHGPHPSSAADPSRSVDPVLDDAALDAAMRIVPRGALTLALVAIGALAAGWLLLYFLLFIPRGPLG